MSPVKSDLLKVLSDENPALPSALEELKFTQRGVVNPRVIDLITLESTGVDGTEFISTAFASAAVDSAEPSPSAQKVVIQMHEDRPFGTDPEQLTQLEAKFNNYVDYILDGWLVRQYPQYKDLPVKIELLTNTTPDETTAKMLVEMSRFAERVGLDFSTCIRN